MSGMSFKRSATFESEPGLQPCKIRRNYLCKDCDYATTNPREYLYHQRDAHNQKGSIHECPYCVYASPHSHKLNRHVSIIHSPGRSEVVRSVPPSLTSERTRLSFSSHGPCSPPSLIRQAKFVSNGSPTLEVILLEDDEPSSSKKVIRRLLMEPAAIMITVPMPKLLPKRKSTACKTSSTLFTTFVKPARLLRTPSLSQKSAKLSSMHKWYSCSLCSFKSKSIIVIQQHEKVFHLKKKFFRCSKCNYVTNVRSRYTKHLRYHSMPYIKCDLCDFSTPYKWNLDRHVRYHLGGGASSSESDSCRLGCKRCSFVATSSQSLNVHVLNHHDGKARSQRIQGEDIEDQTGDGSLKEIDVTGAIKENEVPDEGLGGKLVSESKKEVADDKNVEEDVPTTPGSSIYTCNECEDRFSSVPLLDRHMYECHDIDNPRIPMKRTNPNASGRFRDTKNVVQCDVCSYKAKWVSEMVKHRRVHTLDKPYACAQCKFRTRWKGDMTRHVMRYHDGDVGKPESETPSSTTGENIDCLLDQSMTVGCEGELCIWTPEGHEQNIPLDLSLAGVGDDDDGGPLDDNHASHGGDQASENSIRLSGGKVVHKKYQCPHCNFLTPTPSRFHMHIVAHLNPKPFMCSECGYRSNWQWDITKHSKMKSIRDRAHLGASVVCINEYGSTNYERYEQYAVYEMDNGASSANGVKELKNDDDHSAEINANMPDSVVARRITYKCKHCDYKNPLKKMVVRHMVIHSGNKQKRFCCGVCGHASHWKYIVLRHCHHVHGTSGPILLKDSSPASPPTSDDVIKATSKSRDDELETSKESDLQHKDEVQHIITKDDESCTPVKDDKDKRHKCSICPYQCRKVFDLRIHSYLHRPREGAIFKCLFCPFYVSLKRSWLNHMRLHVDRPQDYAKQLFSDGGQIDLASNESGKATVDTAIAPNPFDTYAGAASSISDNPEGIPRVWVNRGGAIQKMFKCRHCPHVSKKRSVIMTHERMHRKRNIDIGKATYKCPHCNYTSKNAGVLTSHQKVHQEGNTVHSFVTDKTLTEPEDNDSESSKKVPLPQTTNPSMSTSTTIDGGRSSNRLKKNDDKGLGVFASTSTSNEIVAKGYHLCGECPARFTKLRQMLTHRTFHGAALPWQCDKCNYAAKHRPHLHRHERVHTAEYSQSFGSSDESANKQSRHVLQVKEEAAAPVSASSVTVTKTIERKYRCQMCPAVFLKYSTLVYHIHLHSNNGKYQCTHCTYSVSNVGNLARHAKIHGDSIQIDDCNLLDLSQPHDVECSPMASSVPPIAGRPLKRSKGRFACSKCPAVFDKQVRYNVHINLHGSTHRFQCDKCDYAVKFAAILIRHKALHDTEKMEKTQVSILSSSLNDSVATSTPGNVNAPPKIVTNTKSSNPQSEGSACGSGPTMVEKQQLLLQALQSKPMIASESIENIYELKKLFCCDRCPYVHQRKDAVQSHLKRHTSTVPDSSFCPYCDYGTSIHSFLREHIKLHFKPSVHHKPGAFVRWEEFKVWAQSNMWKTLVYEYQFHKSQFKDEDVIQVSMIELIENLKLEEEAKDVVAVVFDILTKVELYNRDVLPNEISADALDDPSTANSKSCPGTSGVCSPMIGSSSSPTIPNAVTVIEDADFHEFALCLAYSA